MNRHTITVLDGALLLLCACITARSFWSLRRHRSGEQLLVIGGGAGEYVYPLGMDGTYHAHGPLGDSTIIVQDGAARFLDSPCPNKTCVQTRPIRRGGDWAACLPNDVFIRIEGSPAQDADALSF